MWRAQIVALTRRQAGLCRRRISRGRVPPGPRRPGPAPWPARGAGDRRAAVAATRARMAVAGAARACARQAGSADRAATVPGAPRPARRLIQPILSMTDFIVNTHRYVHQAYARPPGNFPTPEAARRPPPGPAAERPRLARRPIPPPPGDPEPRPTPINAPATPNSRHLRYVEP